MAKAEDRMLELKVGIFIIVGILLFLIVVFSIGDVYLVKKGYHVNVLFNFANGLTESSPVRLAGVDVGQVDAIDIFYDEKEKKTKVNVKAWIIDENIKIEKDALAIINTLGLLGEKYLEIFPGSDRGSMIPDNGKLIGRDPVATELIGEKFNELADSTMAVMNRLKEGEGTIGRLLTEDKVYQDLEYFVEDIKKHPWKLLHKPKTRKKKESSDKEGAK